MTAIQSIQVAGFTPNQLNKKNTYRDSAVFEFVINDVRFGFGFWGTTFPNSPELGEQPMLALISWTPEGWMLVHKTSAIINGNVGMHMGSDANDLSTYMWHIGVTFTPPLRAYINKVKGQPVNLETWEKVLKLLATLRMEDKKLTFDRAL